MVNLLRRVCHAPSPTRWTGVFDSCKWIIQNRERFNTIINEDLSHRETYNIPDLVIDAIFILSSRLFIFLAAYKTLSRMLEAENMPACFVYPLVLQATEATVDYVVEFKMPGSFAVALKRSINKRFNHSQSGRILKLLYFATPQGRKHFRENPGNTVIHGEDVSAIPESILPSFKFDEEDLKIIEMLKKSIGANVDTANELKEKFVEYRRVLIDPCSGRKCKHVIANGFTEDAAQSSEDIEAATNDPDFNPNYNSSLPDETDIDESDGDVEIDELDWIKEKSTEVRNYQTHTNDYEEDTSESEYDDYSDYDSEEDFELYEDVEVDEK